MTHKDWTMNRSNCFKLLAVCFYEPDKELFLKERLCENLAALFADFNFADSEAAAKKMRVALKEKSHEEMIVDYARLFIGPFEMIASPYGSVYLEDSKRLMGDSTLYVQKMYQEAGLSLEAHEAPDHIALELEFMHFLCFAEAEAAASANNEQVHSLAGKQTKFFRKFLASWVPEFCIAIRNGTNNDFYAALADCLESFVKNVASFYELTDMIHPKEEGCACQAAL